MTFESALRQRLKDDAALAAIVGTNIEWSVRPQAKPLPAIVLQIISDDRSQNMAAFNAYRDTRVQVDCYAPSRSEAAALREGVIAALAPKTTVGSVSFLRAFVNNVIDRGEQTGTTFTHRDLIDLTIWHN